MTLRHALAIAFGVAAFLLVSFFAARWLSAENREREAVTDLIRAQTGGDTQAMLSMLDGCSTSPRCRGLVEFNARTLRRPGTVRILRVDSATAHAVLAKSGRTRVAWDTGGTSFPVVQCVEVERRGVPVLGGPIVLALVGPKIKGDAGCSRRARIAATLAAMSCAALMSVTTASAQTPPVTAPPAAGPPASSIVSTPGSRTLYKDGPSGRFLVDGPWLYRADPSLNGDGKGWQRDPSTNGWMTTTVPNAWNATDESPASFAGAVGWYRKDFRLPSTAKRFMWTARFESINYRVTVWLNGRFLGTHEGAYLPFELRLPRGFLKRTGVNRLVLRVDSRRNASDFPPAKFDDRGRPLGGWWNYGGVLREVYLRAIDDIDFDVVDVRPDLPCATCAATVNWTVRVRNAGLKSRRVTVTGRFGAKRVKLGTVALGPKTSVTLTHRLRVAKPKLWSPERPYLYDASLKAIAGKRTLQSFTRSVGVRSIKVSDGRLVLNGGR